MVFDQKPLEAITQGDLRSLVESGMAEHSRLEYKSEAYGRADHEVREFLQDICMFANLEGGVLLVGVSEIRDSEGQPTGVPHPTAPLGIELQNPSQQIIADTSRIESCIDERLNVQICAIPVQEGRVVIAYRVPNSTARPHCVEYRGHVYFPCRRGAQRGRLDVREIKEMAMRVGSSLGEAKQRLSELLSADTGFRGVPELRVALSPVFRRDFLVDISLDHVRDAFQGFNVRTTTQNQRQVDYRFSGLVREGPQDKAVLHRDGMISSHSLITGTSVQSASRILHGGAIDGLLRNFVMRVQELFRVVDIPGPFILGAVLSAPTTIVMDYQGEGTSIDARLYPFPLVEISNIFDRFERAIRPLCDFSYQIFGKQCSPMFDQEGNWVADF